MTAKKTTGKKPPAKKGKAKGVAQKPAPKPKKGEIRPVTAKQYAEVLAAGVKKPGRKGKPEVKPARPLRVRRVKVNPEEPPVVFHAPKRIPRPLGRPTIYTPQLAELICRRLAKGESLRRICCDSKIPHIDTVLTWALDDKHEFSEHYARARRIQAETLIDELKDIADDSAGDVTVDDEGKETVNAEVIQRAKLRIETRKWIGVKILPKVYGDRVELTAPPAPKKEMTPEETQQRAQAVLQRWGAPGTTSMFAPKAIVGETVDE